MLGKFAGLLIKVVVPLTKSVVAQLATSGSVLQYMVLSKKKMCGQGVVRARNSITLVILNGDTHDIMVIILENSGKLIGGVSEAVKNEI